MFTGGGGDSGNGRMNMVSVIEVNKDFCYFERRFFEFG